MTLRIAETARAGSKAIEKVDGLVLLRWHGNRSAKYDRFGKSDKNSFFARHTV
jgi:hypothetical protein